VYDFSSQNACFQVIEARFAPEKAILGEKQALGWPKIVHKFDFVANFDVFFINTTPVEWARGISPRASRGTARQDTWGSYTVKSLNRGWKVTPGSSQCCMAVMGVL